MLVQGENVCNFAYHPAFICSNGKVFSLALRAELYRRRLIYRHCAFRLDLCP